MVALLFDEHYPFWMVDRVRASGVDAVGLACDRPALRGVDDTEVLRVAVAEGRVVVTEDVRTFPAAIRDIPDHVGVIFVRRSAYPRNPSGMARLEDALLALLKDPPPGLGTAPLEWWI